MGFDDKTDHLLNFIDMLVDVPADAVCFRCGETADENDICERLNIMVVPVASKVAPRIVYVCAKCVKVDEHSFSPSFY